MSVVRLAGISALVAIGPLGFSASAAYAAPAMTVPAANLGPIYPSPLPSGSLPSAGPGVTIVGNCPGFLFTDPVGVSFNSGNAVFYRIPNGDPRLANGGNIEGNATLLDGSIPTSYSGHAHLWFGQNINPTGNQQAYFGETISIQVAGPDGSITITANPGGNFSASGNSNGWGVLKVTCS